MTIIATMELLSTTSTSKSSSKHHNQPKNIHPTVPEVPSLRDTRCVV